MSEQAIPAPRASHPLIHAGKWLLADLLSTLTFVALYALTGSIYAATGLAIALGAGQIITLKFRGRPVDAMQWLSLCLVIVFGGATLLTRDPVFVMLKPSLIYTALGAVMLRRGWMNRYIQGLASTYGADVTTIFGYAWSGLMFATAGANLIVACYASTGTWAKFITVFPIGSKIALVGVQYVLTRTIVRRRIRASRTAAQSAA